MVAGSAVPPSCGDEPASQQAAGSPVVKPALPHPKTKLPFEAQVTHRVRPSLKAAVRTVQTAQHLERKLCLIREGKHARPPSEMPPTLAAGSAAVGSAAAARPRPTRPRPTPPRPTPAAAVGLAAAGPPVRPSLKAAARTVQTAQHLERKLLVIREGKHPRPPSEMPPTLAAGSAAAGLAAAGVEAAGSAKAGLALARETRTVADASSADADGHPRLSRMRTRTDASQMNLGSRIDSPERIVP